ncbi:MAG: hypothetical protein ACPGRC_01395 [Salibacteraceae bacterium]
MVNSTISFPVYRKYEGGFSFFKITSSSSFIELKILGEQISKYEIKAQILPDFQFITDMINLHNNHWVESTEEEFNSKQALIKP